MKSGRLAKLAGVSVDTLHHYERMGVLSTPERLDNGYREYPEDALARVVLIRRALAIGFSLAELAPMLAMRDSGDRPCLDVKRLAKRKLEEIEVRIQDLEFLRDHLRVLLEDWETRLDGMPQDRQARLLETLPEIRTASRPSVRAKCGQRVKEQR